LLRGGRPNCKAALTQGPDRLVDGVCPMEKPAISGDDLRPNGKGDRLRFIRTCLVQLSWESLISGALAGMVYKVRKRKM